MKEIIYEQNDIKSWIYSRKDNDFLYLYISDLNKRIRKSLKTKNIIQARLKSYKIIESYELGVLENPKFKKICADFLVYKNLKSYKDRINQVFLNKWADFKISDLTEKEINKFIFERVKKVKPQTINRDISVLKQILKFSHKRGYIKKIPEIENLKVKNNKRSAYTQNEIKEILNLAEARIHETNHKKIQYDRTMLFYYISFLYFTGIRTSEATSIRFNSINDCIASVTKSKTKVRDVFLNQEAMKIVDKIKQLYKAYNIEFQNNSYIFLNYFGKQIKSFKTSFNHLIQKTSLSQYVGSNKFTPYSFRHTYITKSIKEGKKISTICIQCGTSPEMIGKNYNHLDIHSVKDELS